jgi:hypothetical protein
VHRPVAGPVGAAAGRPATCSLAIAVSVRNPTVTVTGLWRCCGMTDRRIEQRVQDELALLQDLGDSRRVASFKAALARNKRTARSASRRNVDLDNAVRQPARERAGLPFVAVQAHCAQSADVAAKPRAANQQAAAPAATVLVGEQAL